MKVSDLFETNDWNNQEDTLEFLNKKQIAACEMFKYALDRVYAKYQPVEIETIALAKVSWDSARSSECLNSVKNVVQQQSKLTRSITIVLEKFPSLKKSWDLMIHAKQKFEAAGGVYSARKR